MNNASDSTDNVLSKRQLTLLMVGLLTTAVGQSFIFAILPPLGREVHLNEFQINSIIAFSALIFSVGSAWWGRVSDHLGRKRVIVIGLLGYALGTLLFALTFKLGLSGQVLGMRLFILIMVVRCAQAMIMSATHPGTAAYAADFSSRQQRTRTLARLGSANSMGLIAGPVIAGALAGFGLLFPLFCAAALAGTAALTLWRWLPNDEIKHPMDRKAKRLSPFDPRLRSYLLSSFLGFTGFAGIQQTLGFRLQDMLQLTGTETVQQTGWCLMTAALCSLSMQVTVAQRFQGSPTHLIRIGLGMLLAGTLLVATASTFAAVISGMACMGVGLGLMVPAIAAAASLAVTNSEQGAAAGLATAVPAAGFVLGPLMCGSLYTIDAMLSGLGAAAMLAIALATSLIGQSNEHIRTKR